jgi:hypothetical protein
VTTVPAIPDVGLKKKVSAPSAVNVVEGVSPAFVVTFTV